MHPLLPEPDYPAVLKLQQSQAVRDAAMQGLARFDSNLKQSQRFKPDEFRPLYIEAFRQVEQTLPKMAPTLGLGPVTTAMQELVNRQLEPVLQTALAVRRAQQPLVQMSAVIERAMAGLPRVTTSPPSIFMTLTSEPRTHTRTPARVDRVDALLERAHPALVEKRAGMHTPLGRPDGPSQSAESAADLLRILMDRLVPCPDVWRYMRDDLKLDVRGNKGRTRPPKDHHFELIAHRHKLDGPTVMLLSADGQLGNRIEEVKHDSYLWPRAVAESRLLELVAQVEELLEYLASFLSR